MPTPPSPILSAELRAFRGVEQGGVSDLTRLTVLTGANGSGKSAILDGLLLSVHRDAGAALERVVSRHPATVNGARWLVRGGRHDRPAKVLVTAEGMAGALTKLDVTWVPTNPWIQGSPLEEHPPPYSRVTVTRPSRHDGFSRSDSFHFDGSNQMGASANDTDTTHVAGLARPVRLVDSGIPIRLEDAYSEVYQDATSVESLKVLVRPVLQGFREVRPLKDGEEWVLHLEREGEVSVPIGMAGDGVQALLQLALRMAPVSDGLLLVEEPETYLHPRVLRGVAGMMWAAVARGDQIVTTTHSLELIDALIHAAPEGLEDALSLQLLKLERGVLGATRFSHEEMEDARGAVAVDLR